MRSPNGRRPAVSDTPRTDKEATFRPDEDGFTDFVTAEFARNLERELAALQADVAKCHEVIGEDVGSDTSELWGYFETHKQIIARLQESESQLESFADVLMAYREALYDGPENCPSTVSDLLEEKADKVLAKWKEANK